MYTPEKISLILTTIFESTLAISILVDLFFFSLKIRNQLVLTAVILIELVIFSTGSVVTIPQQILSQISITIPEIGLDRYLTSADFIPYTGLFNYWNHYKVRIPFGHDLSASELDGYPRLKQELKQIPANTNFIYGLYNVAGYSSVVLSRYADFWDSANINGINITSSVDSRLSLLGVNYFITGFPDDYFQEDSDKTLISTDPLIYRSINPNSRVFFLEPDNQPTITSYTPNRITIDTNNRSPNTLVLSDSYYPGWQAYVDGQQVDIQPYQGAFRSVALPKSSQSVVFIYQPLSVTIGGIISASTLFAILLYHFLWERTKQQLSFLTGTAKKTPKNV